MKGLRPALSIIVPVYNVERYLTECIDSVLSSSFTDYELILVDDGSTDSSGLICDEYSQKDSRVKVLHQTNSGVSHARNVGIRSAHAKWVMFVDSDDCVADTFIANLYRAVEEYPDADFIHGGFTNYRNGTIAEVAQSYSPYCGSDMNYLFPIYRGRPYSKLFRMELLKKCVFDEQVSSAEDLLFTTDYLFLVKKYVLLSETGYFYRCDNANSIMHTPHLIKYEQSLHFFYHQFEGVEKLIKKHHIDYSSSLLRLTHTADSMVFAIYSLYKDKNYNHKRLQHLRKDFTSEQLQLLRFSSGKRIKVLFFFLQHRYYKIFNLLMMLQ